MLALILVLAATTHGAVDREAAPPAERNWSRDQFRGVTDVASAPDPVATLDLTFDNAKSLAAVDAGVAASPAAAQAAADAEKPPFEGEIEAFEAADRKQPPPKGAVLFIGSSSIHFWESLAKDFDGTKVINRGFGGSRIADSTRYFDRIVAPYAPREIVMYGGDNDVAEGDPPEQVLADFQAFVAKVDAALPGTPIVFVSIKPSPARAALINKMRQANSLVRGFARRRGIEYVDVFTPMLDKSGKPRGELFGEDGLHMNPAGYALWTKLIAPALKKKTKKMTTLRP